ncbi:nucleotide exchange factor GrpE, partial [Candidatus Pelagibacter sp.]|nr:nucleotide exchange factor GrpE [Candidatus Pelagibacter sp.]
MKKEESQNLNDETPKEKLDKNVNANENIQNLENEKKDEQVEKSPEEKLFEIEDKLTRTLAEMENQRRRFEKEKEEAFEYGGFAFAKEALNLIDNLERSKQVLENDETIKNTEALKKTLEHLKIIN